MAAVRKSVVSTTGTWFQRNSSQSVNKQPFAPLGTVRESTSGHTVEPLVSSKRKRSSAKNAPVSTHNGVRSPDKPKASNLKGQSPKNPKASFLGMPVVPTAKAIPVWLLRLYTLHRYSSVVAFSLVTATLVVYGWTVYSQEIWSQGYRRLQNLQRQERQLTTTNATLTNKMAQEAERPTTGLVSPTPARTIFLSPAPLNSDSTSPNTKPNSQIQPQTSSPLGY